MKKYKFKAQIEAGDGGGAYVLFPYNTAKEFGTKGKVPVKATFNGLPYSGSLIKYGHPLHSLGMPKGIREQTGKGPSDIVEVVVWKDEEVRTVEVPAQFENLMKREGLLPVFKELSYTYRKEYCRWITEAKKEETRLRRFEKAIEMLKKKVSTPGSRCFLPRTAQDGLPRLEIIHLPDNAARGQDPIRKTTSPVRRLTRR
jgi:hypothetical protein